MEVYDEMLADVVRGHASRTSTEENLQARIRGNLLMALSNKFGWLVLTTGNKSEIAVGYSTLYGDMAGGFAVIKDVPEDARLRARATTATRATDAIPVPQSIIDRPPSAELRPDQKDADSLPPYDVLDRDPRGLRRGGPRPRAADRRGPATRGRGPRDRAGRPGRVQAPPGPAGHQDHPAGFGRDRRMPITNRYRRLSGISRTADGSCARGRTAARRRR